jgi:hypothetical protein
LTFSKNRASGPRRDPLRGARHRSARSKIPNRNARIDLNGEACGFVAETSFTEILSRRGQKAAKAGAARRVKTTCRHSKTGFVKKTTG